MLEEHFDSGDLGEVARSLAEQVHLALYISSLQLVSLQIQSAMNMHMTSITAWDCIK